MPISSRNFFFKKKNQPHQNFQRGHQGPNTNPLKAQQFSHRYQQEENLALYEMYFTLPTAREHYLYSVRQCCEYTSVPQFAWNHQPTLTNKTVKESEHVSSCLLFPFELYLVHSLQSNQLIKHCNLNCRKMYGENLYTGCLLSERAIHEMSLAERISL